MMCLSTEQNVLVVALEISAHRIDQCLNEESAEVAIAVEDYLLNR